MKKAFASLMVWFLLAAFIPPSFFAPAAPADHPIWLPAVEGNPPSNPVVQSQVLVGHAIQLEIQFSGIWAESLSNDFGSYTRLYLDGYGQSGNFGQPDLPIYTVLLDLPSEKNVQIEILNQRTRTLSLQDYGLPRVVMPEQLLRPKSSEEPPWQSPDRSIYTRNHVFPPQTAALGAPYQLRNHHIQPIQLSPVLYNPISAEIELVQSITLSVTWQEPSSDELARSERLKDSTFDQLLESSVIPVSATDSVKNPSAGGSYLIISPDLFLSTLTPLVDLKISQGYTVRLVSLSQIGSSSLNSIRNFIVNEYLNGKSPPSYLLLVGDTNFIPAWSRNERESMKIARKSDLYYATMDSSSDFVPDLLYGRLPARNSQQLIYLINKIIAQANLNGSENWVKKAAFIASCDSGYYDLAEDTQTYVISNHTLPAGYSGTFPLNPQPGGDQLYCVTNSARTTNIVNAVNDQRAFIAYSGHGSETAWSESLINFTTTHIQNLAANPALPLVTSFACLTGDFGNDTYTTSFGETWVLQQGKGAVAFLGSADNSFWDPDDELEKAMYDTLFATPEAPPPVSQAIFDGLQAVHSLFPTTAQYYFETYNLMGDPSTRMWLGPRNSDFGLTISDAHIDVCAGAESTTPVSVSSLEGFSNPVTLSLSSLPAGVNSSFSINPVIPPDSSQLTVSSQESTIPGSYPISLLGTSGATVHTLPVDLSVSAQNPLTPQPISPAPNDTPQPLLPTFSWDPAPWAVSYHLQVALDPEFSRLVIDQASLRTTSFTPPDELPAASVFYWRVQSSNGCGNSPYSPAVIFTTLVQVGDCSDIPLQHATYTASFESSPSDWTSSTWFLSPDRYMSPVQSFHAAAPDNVLSQQLTSPAITIPPGELAPTLRFWHWRDLEDSPSGCMDGGTLEYSINDGTSWSPIPEAWVIDSNLSYDGLISTNYANPLGGQPAWCGNQSWQRPVINLTEIAGQNASFRYQLGSDLSIGTEGWYIDDFEILYCQENYQFQLESSESVKSAEPGDSVTYTIALVNTGSLDSYQITSSGNNWVTTITPNSVNDLDFMQSILIDIQVAIPSEAISGQSDIATITFSSIMNPTVEHSISVTTTATQYSLFYLPLMLNP